MRNSGERLLENLALDVEPFALCEVASGWRLRLDGLASATLHFVVEGDGRLQTAGAGSYPIGAGALAIVPPRLTHSLASGEAATHEISSYSSARDRDGLRCFEAGPVEGRCLRVACGRLRASYAGSLGVFDLMRTALVLDFSRSEQMRTTFGHLLEEQRAPSPGSGAMIATLMKECLVLVLRRLLEAPSPELSWLYALDDSRLARTVDSVLDEPALPHSLDSLAAKALMSRSVFAERFTASFGRTPMAFVRDVRLRKGAELLRSTDLPVDAVARRVGYASRSHFSQVFRKHFGLSPAGFREGSQEGVGTSPIAR